MTAEKLQDAISHLPMDLLAETDKLRCRPKRKEIHWQRWVSLAACLVLVLSVTLVFGRVMQSGMGGAAESAAEAPAAMAPVVESQKATADEVCPESPSDLAVPEAPASEEVLPEPPVDADAAEVPYGEESGRGDDREQPVIDHSHRFAEPIEESGSTAAYCGNLVTTVYLDGEAYSITGGDSVTVTSILIHLDYDLNQVCRCMAQFTVDTESLSGIEVNLTEGFARCEQGQAALTQAQAKQIQDIIDNLR